MCSGGLQDARLVNDSIARPSRAFWRQIAIVLAAKAVALLALYFLFFASAPQALDVPQHMFHVGEVR